MNMSAVNFDDVVVWNPWAAKAKQMSDFGDDEYKHMVRGRGHALFDAAAPSLSISRI